MRPVPPRALGAPPPAVGRARPCCRYHRTDAAPATEVLMTTQAPQTRSASIRRRLPLAAATLAALAVALLGASAVANPATTTSRHADLQNDADALVAAGVPGAILVIRSGDHTVRIVSGVGNVDTRTPMRAGDRFRIG